MTEYSTDDFQKLMAGVGSLIFYWCLLEDELSADIRRLRSESEGPANLVRVRGTFADQLREWRGLLSQRTRRKPELAVAVAELANEMELLRLRRNLVAHDFAGASARPEDGEAYISCSHSGRGGPNAESTRITLSELNATIEAIDRCRLRIKRVAAEEAAPA